MYVVTQQVCSEVNITQKCLPRYTEKHVENIGGNEFYDQELPYMSFSNDINPVMEFLYGIPPINESEWITSSKWHSVLFSYNIELQNVSQVKTIKK